MNKRFEGRSRIALLVVGVMIGGMLLTPAGAHVGGTVGHLWKSHLKAKVLKLNYQTRCKDGAGLAHGYVIGSEGDTFPSEYTTDAAYIKNNYNCKSATNEVRVKRTGAGNFDISLPGISNNLSNTGNMVVLVSPTGLCFFGCSDSIAYYLPIEEEGQGWVIHVTIGDSQPSDDAADTNTLIDLNFSFQVLDFS